MPITERITTGIITIIATYILARDGILSIRRAGTRIIKSRAVSIAFLVFTRPENMVPSSAKLGGII